MARTRLKQSISTTEASANTAIYQRWLSKNRPHDIIIYSIVVQFLTSKAPTLVKFEHGNIGPRTTFEKYSHPTRHGTNLSHCSFRFDRPEYVPHSHEIALATRTNEAADTVTTVYEYEDVEA